jgi:hypothetical protein
MLFDPTKFGHAEELHVVEHPSLFVLSVTSK